jgi:prenyl protein peptidase
VTLVGDQVCGCCLSLASIVLAQLARTDWSDPKQPANMGLGDLLSLEQLTWPVAVAASLGLSTAYVAILYVLPGKARDEPATIRQRVVAVSAVTLVAPLAVYALANVDPAGEHLWSLIGLRVRGISNTLGLTMLLFAGPLLQECANGQLEPPTADLLALRNLVVAPITEEILFRGCILPLMLPAVGATKAVLLSPLFFGVAHLHHVFQGKHPLACLFQFVYTTVFGWLTCFFFVRTGSVLGPIACHAFCNFMGFPDVAGAFAGSRPWVRAAYIGGLLAFGYLLVPLTASDRLLY